MFRLMVAFAILTIYTKCGSSTAIKDSGAASPGQIRFALENNYDATGPGSKHAETGYHTYNNIDDALIPFLDDPDTKLPERERARATAYLYAKNGYYENLIPDKPPNPFVKIRPKSPLPKVLKSYSQGNFEEPRINMYRLNDESIRPPALGRIPAKAEYPIVVKEYQYRPSPDVEFLDIHDKETGDSKSAQELRDGSHAMHGYFAREVWKGEKPFLPSSRAWIQLYLPYQVNPQDELQSDYYYSRSYRGIPIRMGRPSSR